MKFGQLSVLSTAALLAAGMTIAMAQSNPAPTPGSGGSAPGTNAAAQGKCWDAAEKEFKLPGYENWPGYAANLQFIARRYCGYWGRGT